VQSQIPNIRLQIPNKFQFVIRNDRDASVLKFESWSLELIGHLCLVFGASRARKQLLSPFCQQPHREAIEKVPGKDSTKDQVSEAGFSTLSCGVSFAGAFSGFFLSLSFAAPTRVFASSLARSFLFSLFRFLLLASSRSFSRLGMLSSF
jgi:hypothetical protein